MFIKHLVISTLAVMGLSLTTDLSRLLLSLGTG